jgi:hypothetical protein
MQPRVCCGGAYNTAQLRYLFSLVSSKVCYIMSKKGYKFFIFLFHGHGATAHSGPRSPHCQGFTITLKTAHSIGPLWTGDEPDLMTHNTYKRQTSIPPAGFQSANPARDRPKTHAVDRAASGIGKNALNTSYKHYMLVAGVHI